MAWKWDPYRCQGVYVRKVCVFSALDLPWLLAAPQLVANKFNASLDPLVLDCLERSLELRAQQGFGEVTDRALDDRDDHRLVSTLNWTYYRALPHLHNRA